MAAEAATDAAGNEWINGYLEAILDAGKKIRQEQQQQNGNNKMKLSEFEEQAAVTTMNNTNRSNTKDFFNPTNYFVQEVITSFDESDLYKTWTKGRTHIWVQVDSPDTASFDVDAIFVVKWGIDLSKLAVFVGEKGDTDYDDLLAGLHKTIVVMGSVDFGSENLLRSEDGFKREDAVPEESPNITSSENCEAHNISAAVQAFGIK